MPIAIDMGTFNLHLVQGQASSKQVSIRQCATEPLHVGLVQDGVIREFGGLEVTLRNMLTKNRITDRNCIVTINGSNILTREITVPRAKPKVMDDVVTFELASTLSGSEEVAVEYTLLKQAIPDQPDMVKVRASAINKDYVRDYHKLLKGCGLTPVAMDIHPNALCKIIDSTPINDHTIREGISTMFLDIGAVTTTAYIVTNGEITYTRIIPMGGMDIERYITAVKNDDSTDDRIEFGTLDLSLANLRNSEALADAVRPLVTSINDAIQRIQQFLSGRLQNGKVERVYIYGQTALYPNFEKTLGEAFGLQTELIHRIGKVNMPGNEPIAPYINAIGSLIRIED